MSVDDPRAEFWMLVREIEAGRVSEAAVQFVDSAFATVDGIMETIESMEANGVDAPTPRQKQALANLHSAACRWLGRIPSDDEGRAELAEHSNSTVAERRVPRLRPSKAQGAVRIVRHYPKM